MSVLLQVNSGALTSDGVFTGRSTGCLISVHWCVYPQVSQWMVLFVSLDDSCLSINHHFGKLKGGADCRLAIVVYPMAGLLKFGKSISYYLSVQWQIYARLLWWSSSVHRRENCV